MSLEATLAFPPARLPEAADTLRQEVRAFLSETQRAGLWAPQSNFMAGFSPPFSRALGEQGWLGMTWPVAYGGHARSALERYVVTEELLAAGAPVAAHWIADRQSGPQFLRFGTEEQRESILPRIAAGDCYFSIGMSEPDSGSDLASLRTRAERTADGWRITGAKIWTSNAHLNHYMIALCRTGDAGPDRHGGLSQFLIDLKNDALTINPIHNLLGAHDFNEVVFDGTEIPPGRIIGKEGDGWRQVTSELAYERSGPERFLSTYRLLVELVRHVAPAPDRHALDAIGGLTASLFSLRQMSLSVAGLLDQGEAPDMAAAVVKDVGTLFEREVAETVRRIAEIEPAPDRQSNTPAFAAMLAETILHIPSFTLRGGTNEIMRNIIARGLGLR